MKLPYIPADYDRSTNTTPASSGLLNLGVITFFESSITSSNALLASSLVLVFPCTTIGSRRYRLKRHEMTATNSIWLNLRPGQTLGPVLHAIKAAPGGGGAMDSFPVFASVWIQRRGRHSRESGPHQRGSLWMPAKLLDTYVPAGMTIFRSWTRRIWLSWDDQRGASEIGPHRRKVSYCAVSVCCY